MEPKQILSPKSNRWIDVYGPAYNKLLKEGYTEAQLLKGYKMPSKTKNKKILSVYKQKKEHLESIIIPDEILFEEIIMQMDTLDFMSICQTNKKFYNLCHDKKFWEKMYNKYYRMRAILPDMPFSELFKQCYGLYLLQKVSFRDKTIIDLFRAESIIIPVNIHKKLKGLLHYLYNLKKITFTAPDILNPPPLPEKLNELPFLTEIIYKKV